MEIRREQAPTEYMKIRKRLLGLVFKAGPEPLKLASSRTLAKQFGVAHMTVARVMKDLAEDGFLVVKPGIGAFASPKNENVFKEAKVFGIVVGDGKYAFFDRIEIKLFSSFMDGMIRRSKDNWVQHYSILSRLDSAAREILDAGLDGLIWVMPPEKCAPLLKTLKAKRLPLFCVGRKFEGISSARVDFEKDNYRIAKRMLEEGRRKICLALMERPSFPQDGAEAGVEKAFAEFGLRYEKAWTVYGTAEEHKGFSKTMKAIKPDGLIFNDSIRPYWNEIEAHPETFSKCLLYSEDWELRDDMGYKGLVGVRDLAPVAKDAADNLRLQLEGFASVLDCALPLKIEEARGA